MAVAPDNNVCGQNTQNFTVSPMSLGTPIPGTLTDATRDAGMMSCPCKLTGVDVYHYFTPMVSDGYVISTCGLTNAETVISVHTGCPASIANEVIGGCSDDGTPDCGFQSSPKVALTAGVTYVIRIGVYDENITAGPYSFVIQSLSSPANDYCLGSNPTLTIGTPVMSSNVGATTSVVADRTNSIFCPGTDASFGGSDVFYRFLAPTTSSYRFSTCSTEMDSVISIHDGCPATFDNCLGFNDYNTHCPLNSPGDSGGAAVLDVMLQGGHTYSVRVAGAPLSSGDWYMDSFTLEVTNQSAATTGACCYEIEGVGNICRLIEPADCSGEFRGLGTVCSPTLCSSAPTMGICCKGSTCAVTLENNCSGTNTHWYSPSSPGSPACNAPGNFTQPCCKADFNQSGSVTVTDIFAFLSGWFGASTFADANASGTVTVSDIFSFLSAWFAGCH